MSAVERWILRLTEHTGLSRAEAEHRRALLLQFCAARYIAPDDLAAACRLPEGLSRWLVAARESPADLVVQSFLVHNGINVFGDLVCMPHTSNQLAEQGERWDDRRRPPAAGPR